MDLQLQSGDLRLYSHQLTEYTSTFTVRLSYKHSMCEEKRARALFIAGRSALG